MGKLKGFEKAWDAYILGNDANAKDITLCIWAQCTKMHNEKLKEIANSPFSKAAKAEASWIIKDHINVPNKLEKWNSCAIRL